MTVQLDQLLCPGIGGGGDSHPSVADAVAAKYIADLAGCAGGRGEVDRSVSGDRQSRVQIS
ncbi:hypothetical protein [Nocardia ignorata]|uniref:hypothetical protein n=1 Tax=Nocardia ignorata TaxID=145285 RepID=UPI001FB6E8D4|nr:hypothetical protein [Nocardia ignorata]